VGSTQRAVSAATVAPPVPSLGGPAVHSPLSRSSRWWIWAPAALFVMLYLALVGTAAGQQLDETAMRRVAATADSSTWAKLTLLAVSAGSMLLATGLVVIATALLRGRRHAVIGAVAAVTVVGVAQLLKLVLDRPGFLAGVAGNSFPSGHVAAVAGLAVALVIAVPRTSRWLVAVMVAGPPVGVTGLATIVLLWHRPSDVVGSVLLAVAIGALATRLVDQPRATESAHSR
jgi:membrane-associated phospholipid phosphatase